MQFNGGEPTLHPDLPTLVKHALGQGLKVEIFSNLVQVTPASWDLFSLTGVSLATSYYSDDPRQHSAITGRRGSHARTRANLAEVVRRGIPVRVGVIDLGDAQRWKQAVAEIKALGVTDVGADDMRGVGRGGVALSRAWTSSAGAAPRRCWRSGLTGPRDPVSSRGGPKWRSGMSGKAPWSTSWLARRWPTCAGESTSPSEPGAVLDLSDEAAPPDVGRGHRVARHILGRTSDQRATGPESERSLLSGGCTPTVV